MFMIIHFRVRRRIIKKRKGIDYTARTIREEDLQAAVVTVVNDAWTRKGKVIGALKENIRKDGSRIWQKNIMFKQS